MSKNSDSWSDYDEDWEKKGDVDPSDVDYDLPPDALDSDIEPDPFDHINEIECDDEAPEESDELGSPNYGFEESEDTWEHTLDDFYKW